MTFTTWTFAPFLAGGPDDPDGQGAEAFLAEMTAHLEAREVELTPPVALCLSEVLSATLIVRRLEHALLAQGVLDASTQAPNPLLTLLSKWHERRRKALKELDRLGNSDCHHLPQKPPTNAPEVPTPHVPLTAPEPSPQLRTANSELRTTSVAVPVSAVLDPQFKPSTVPASPQRPPRTVARPTIPGLTDPAERRRLAVQPKAPSPPRVSSAATPPA